MSFLSQRGARAVLFGLAFASLAACGEDERSPVGPGSPAAKYCARLGYRWADSQCVFPDGTSCRDFQFYQGECGQTQSYCVKHGGTLSTETRNMGSWTGVVAVCTVPGGAKCDEEQYSSSGRCP